jgi:predicted oxidoreductase
MKITLSKNGPELSRIVAGVMYWGEWGVKLGKNEMANLISQCVELDVTSFDHADLYGGYTTEADFGKAFAETGINRNSIQIISKCGICFPCNERSHFGLKHYNTSKKYIIECVERSLLNLQTDYLDLLLIHRPSPIMGYEDMANALDLLISQGKILTAGVSNFTPIQVKSFLKFFPIVTNQIEASLLHVDPFLDGSLDVCQKHQIKPMAWSPLSGGKLFAAQSDPGEIVKLSTFKECSEKWQIPLDELAYTFLLHHPASILPVTGSSKIERIKSAVNALSHHLTDEQWFELWTASIGKDVP